MAKRNFKRLAAKPLTSPPRGWPCSLIWILKGYDAVVYVLVLSTRFGGFVVFWPLFRNLDRERKRTRGFRGGNA